ncbi:MAG: rhomboid family intramembrane serine protease [Candidatus Bathyarchaeota archaeon]|uniref:rhomboid family intramembrane serine protease n=1 Tax=Candidatus Bathycorpusculum sp. TaxID=2994959 RepID=UPI00282E3D20|nr:rhomboid family intramembrane serine protease [Candidatus Termiticorpusculum sp.]MCL2257386.1 rhomboid family intramembrane serine protease [Candidatus Termiticorpusculum sp.]MCL2292515.1 rhomboid family intramembrane serine protease [Candidatus Termiticorpusculum sp.]
MFLKPNIKSSQRYKITYVLIALNIVLYIYCAIVSGNAFEISNSVAESLGQANGLILDVGFPYYYQLFTAMFIHADLMHIAGNMMFLLIFGLRAEEMFSLPEYLGIYIIGGLTGNLLTLASGPFYLSVGASGAIFALFGACILYDRKFARQSILGALMFAGFLLLMNMGERVNILSHIGGLVFGLIAGYILASKHRSAIEKQYTVNYSYPS